ncbi:MAG: phosphoribosylformylglycinamidine cyclo-ligase [Dehalococcoidia bacterium]
MAPQRDASQQTYRGAGVDIDAATRAKELIKPLARATRRPGVIGDIGFFGGLFQVQGYRDPVLVASTDSVGTKVVLARQMGRLETIGIDLVNHCVNDIAVAGADPQFFLDYIGLGKLVPEETEQIVRGVADACKATGCALIGGETAELPGLYRAGDFDLVGFIVGAVERDAIIDGSAIQVGDAVLGIPSSGLHTNGYSLARQVFRTDDDPRVLERYEADLGRTLGEALLEPHRAYYPMIKPALPYVRGMAHITGGGLVGNIPRILPDGVAAHLDRGTWDVPPIFRLIQEASAVPEDEMDRVYNMGIGLVIVAGPEEAQEITRLVPEASLIGMIVPQSESARVKLFRG